MKTKFKMSILLMALSSVAYSNDNIENQNLNKGSAAINSQGINNVYFTHNTVSGIDYKRLSIVMENEFQGCPEFKDAPPASKWAEIRESDLGEKRFDMLSSAVLSAVLADKTVSIIISDDECYNTRAKITSIRVNK